MKILKYVLSLLAVSILPVWGSAQELRMPADNAVAGWMRFEKVRNYAQNDLYGYIDGGAELFLELGFKDLTIQKYHKGNSEIAIEAYRMESPDAALAIYLFKCGKETPLTGITVRNTGDQYQLMLLKGDYFLLVNNFQGDKAILPAMIEFANKTLKNILTGRPSELFKILLAENIIKGSELILRGPYSLQSLVTLGQGDILQLSGKIYGVAADYKDNRGAAYTRIVISYPDTNAAQSAFDNLLTHLDPYLKVIQKSKDSFTFQNAKGKTSIAELHGQILNLSLYLK